jgi:hypothetical protein
MINDLKEWDKAMQCNGNTSGNRSYILLWESKMDMHMVAHIHFKRYNVVVQMYFVFLYGYFILNIIMCQKSLKLLFTPFVLKDFFGGSQLHLVVLLERNVVVLYFGFSNSSLAYLVQEISLSRIGWCFNEHDYVFQNPSLVCRSFLNVRQSDIYFLFFYRWKTTTYPKNTRRANWVKISPCNCAALQCDITLRTCNTLHSTRKAI